MPKVKLNKKQKTTVNDWCDEHNGKTVQIIDRDCHYRGVIVDWAREIPQPHLNQKVIIYYRTDLDITPSGKIREELHRQKEVQCVQAEEFEAGTQLVLPLGEIINRLPPLPEDITRYYLFPKDKNIRRSPTKQSKPKQQTLPLDGVAAKLHQLGLEKGRQTESTESLLAGKVDHYSLDQGKVIPLPQAFVDLLTDLECSNEEWELIINFYQVLRPDDVLRIIEEIPVMRDIPQYGTFTHPRTKIITPTTTSNSQPQRLTPNNYTT